MLLLTKKLAMLALLMSFLLQEGELLRTLKLILSSVVAIRSQVSLIHWKDFLYTAVMYMVEVHGLKGGKRSCGVFISHL